MDRSIYVGTLVRHFKGHLYSIINPDAYNSETGERVVIYSSLEDDIWWVRPYEMFMSEVDREKYPDAKQKYRFEIMEN